MQAKEEVRMRLQELKENALEVKWFKKSDIELIKENENFKSDPNLALIMFHSSGANPKAHIYNNESLVNDKTCAEERISNEIENDLSYEDVCQLYHDAIDNSAKNKPLWICASCCEIIMLLNRKVKVHKCSLEELHSNFKIESSKVDSIFEKYEEKIIEDHFSMLKGDDSNWYYLNPDLVGSNDSICLCSRCYKDPLSHPYSIANGHDYGRIGKLPNLNFVTKNTISLVRLFGQTMHLNSKTRSGHTITFDSNGPQVCVSSMLEALDENCIPQVTFIGTKEKWRIEQKKYKNLYSISATAVFAWLDILSNINDMFLSKKISFSERESVKSRIAELNELIANSAIVTNDSIISKIDELKSGDRYGSDESIQNNNSNDDNMLLREVCLVNDKKLFTNETSNIAKKLVETLNLKSNTTKNSEDKNNSKENLLRNHIWPVERKDEPLCEWTENNLLFRGCFPYLFLRGCNMLPKSSFPPSLIKHFYLYYDGRFEQTQCFTHLLFNQLIRHTAIRKIARAESSNKKYLEKLGNLMQREDFKNALLEASSNPEEKSSKVLNSKLMRILSFAGKDLPFSAFERSQSKAKFSSMSMKYGFQSSFITIAPPEQDNLCLLKLHLIRETKNYNAKINDDLYSDNNFTWDQLPEELKNSPRKRLLISQKMPAQSVLAYLRTIDTLLVDLIKCPESKDTRVSRSYFDRQNSVLGKVGGVIGVTEPQSDSRLHLHLLTYPSTMSPNLLTEIIASDSLREKAKCWIDRTCTTYLSDETHAWLDELSKENKKVPRSSEIPLAFIEIDNSDKEVWSKERLRYEMSNILESFKILLEKKIAVLVFISTHLLAKKESKGNFFAG